MKTNGNNLVTKDYYLGLDIGPSHVGYAVTDLDYNLLRFKGNSMWGVRIFDEGKVGSRRLNRSNRRRLVRKNWRLELFRKIFEQEILKVDPNFLLRLHDSALAAEDKTLGTKWAKFADPGYNDHHHNAKYPTIYHLRNELIENPAPHDVRLVYLALHHIIKVRGHFLFELGEGTADFATAITNLISIFRDTTGIDLMVADMGALHDALALKRIKKKDKAEKIRDTISFASSDDLDLKQAEKAVDRLAALFAGSKVKMIDLFGPESFEEPDEIGSIALDDSEVLWEEMLEKIGDMGDVLLCAKAVSDCLKLEEITGSYEWLSQYKIEQYNQHKRDKSLLKAYIKSLPNAAALRKKIFVIKDSSDANYSAYIAETDRKTRCDQEGFCAFLKKTLPACPENAAKEIKEMYQRIEENSFCPKLRTKENAIIPHSLHQKELDAILRNASAYLPFLNESDESGLTAAERIQQIFNFRVPYFVGPLNNKSERSWVVRSNEKILPWNFSDVVDFSASAKKFIETLTTNCTYSGEATLPRNSLLFSEFCVLNEINNLKINGAPISVACKKHLYQDLFVDRSDRTTRKKIHQWMVKNGYARKEDVISGVPEVLSSTLASYHKMKGIIYRYGYEQTEEIILRCLVYSGDVRMLKQWLRENTELTDNDIEYVTRQKFKDWGNLSAELLNGFRHIDPETGETFTILERMRDSNENLNQLLSNDYTFLAQATEHKRKVSGGNVTPRAVVDGMYISPAVRRSIWQALRIVDEIVDIMKGAPVKIFVEVARQTPKTDKERGESEKKQLMAMYKRCGLDKDPLYERLCAEDENALRSDQVFLYYTQMGRCMYTGEIIDYAKLRDKDIYNIDHIYPRSKIKDDSLHNKVLVRADYNSVTKKDIYPVEEATRTSMNGFWHDLFKKKLISEEKFARLTRSTELTAEELSSFVQRHITETRQSSKAVADLLSQIYPSRIVYAKASNMNEFRQTFGFVKCPEVNDLAYAKDAYLNIAVGNYFDTRFTEKFFANIKKEKYSINPKVMYSYWVKGAWDGRPEGTIATIRKTMAKNNIRYTRQTVERSGELFKLMPMPAGRGQVPLKQGKDIAKYGGYDKPAGAYFALVEIPDKKGLSRVLLPILAYQRVEYERDPSTFARMHWGAKAHIIREKVPFYTLLDVHGTRIHITGRTGNRVVGIHATQLVVDPDTEIYLKKVVKFARRNRKLGGKAVLSEREGITKDLNAEIYDLFLHKLTSRCYSATILGCTYKNLLESRKKFAEISAEAQCNILTECLKVFHCNPEKANVDGFCAGTKTVGSVSIGNKLDPGTTFIYQSITGLYEYSFTI